MHGFIRAASRLPRRHDDSSIGGARASQTQARRVAIEPTISLRFATLSAARWAPWLQAFGAIANWPVRLPCSRLP